MRSSRIAAQHGAKVAVAEDRYLGGTCVNVGCVPKKLLVYGSHFGEWIEDGRGYGWTVGDVSFDWATLIANKDKEIGRLNGVYERLLTGAGVEIVDGRAAMADAHTVEVAGKSYTADKVLVATGGWPTVPDIPGKEHAITSNEAFYLKELPRRIAIVGGGYIAVEFAGIFNGLGAEVSLLYRGGLFLRGFDDDARTFLAEEMTKKGVDLCFDTQVRSIGREERGGKPVYVLDLEHGETMEVDLVMYATGRHPNTQGIGLDAAGVALAENGAVKVDKHWKTSVSNVYAIGDVTDRIQLTPVAIAEGHALADNLFGTGDRTVSYEDVPSAVFSQPNLANVGLTEAQARERHGEVDVYKSTFKPMLHTLSGRDERALMKMIVARESGLVVGIHMVGPEAGEIMQGLAVAVKAGATKADFDATIGIHPTAAEEFVTMRTPEPDPDEVGAQAAE